MARVALDSNLTQRVRHALLAGAQAWYVGYEDEPDKNEFILHSHKDGIHFRSVGRWSDPKPYPNYRHTSYQVSFDKCETWSEDTVLSADIKPAFQKKANVMIQNHTQAEPKQ